MDTYSDEVMRVELAERRSRLEQAIGRGGEAAQVRALIADVDAALARLEAGTFGRCDVCHDPIEPERLIADPLIRTCLDHLTSSEQRALEQDLDLAARIQAGLLPRRRVTVPGWEVAYHFEPAGPVGGDYCDVITPERGDGTFFLLGDVSGKGVAASILMANLHATFRTLAEADLPLGVLWRGRTGSSARARSTITTRRSSAGARRSRGTSRSPAPATGRRSSSGRIAWSR